MIEIVEPFNRGKVVRLNLGEKDWYLGKSSFPLLDSPWVNEEMRQQVLNLLIPPHFQEGLKTPDKPVLTPVLPWVWGNAFDSVLRGVQRVLEPIVEHAEGDLYCETWRSKFSFLNGLREVKLNWAACMLAARFGDDYAKRAWEHKDQSSQFRESITGRVYSHDGIPWAQISSHNRPLIVDLQKDQSIWDCDLISAEPALIVSILKYIAPNELESFENCIDAYEVLTHLLQLPEKLERKEKKSLVMAALYGAGIGALNKWNIDNQKFKKIVWLRETLENSIQHIFQGRTWGGKELTEQSLSHWVQGSAADISYEVFSKIQKNDPNIQPFACLHDGAMWLTNKNWEPNIQEITSKPVIQNNKTKNLMHCANIRWKLLRTFAS
jgi:hypothetical protein